MHVRRGIRFDGRTGAVVLKVLRFLNWVALAVGALMALLYAVVCLMMLPYPQLVAQSGGGFGDVLRTFLVWLALAGAAGLGTWLLQKRHRYWWVGQWLLAAAVIAVLAFNVLGLG